MIRLATVSPCYNEEEVLRHSVERMTALFERMMAEGLISNDSMMVFVNDGSRDRTWLCRMTSSAFLRWCVISKRATISSTV